MVLYGNIIELSYALPGLSASPCPASSWMPCGASPRNATCAPPPPPILPGSYPTSYSPQRERGEKDPLSFGVGRLTGGAIESCLHRATKQERCWLDPGLWSPICSPLLTLPSPLPPTPTGTSRWVIVTWVEEEVILH